MWLYAAYVTAAKVFSNEHSKLIYLLNFSVYIYTICSVSFLLYCAG